MGSDQDRVLGTNRGEKARCTVRERGREREKEENKLAAEGKRLDALGSTMDPMAVRNSGSE